MHRPINQSFWIMVWYCWMFSQFIFASSSKSNVCSCLKLNWLCKNRMKKRERENRMGKRKRRKKERKKNKICRFPCSFSFSPIDNNKIGDREELYEINHARKSYSMNLYAHLVNCWYKHHGGLTHRHDDDDIFSIRICWSDHLHFDLTQSSIHAYIP